MTQFFFGYRIDLRLIDSKNNQLASGTVYERAIFSLEEMKVLMQKAINHTGTEMQPFTFLYRCKPKIYWDYVVSETRAEMNVYGKDSNGQAASPINTAISGRNCFFIIYFFVLGLFFSARLDPKGHVPTQSPFGEVRFMLPAYMLLQPHLNLYFADFYCNSKPHYVTVVVCREHSDADRLCRRTLLPLAPFDNPFLLFQHSTSPTTPVTYSANRNVWVEIYYTDNVPLSWGHLHHIHTFGVGTSKIGGLPHNKGCRVCNLYPQGPSAAELVAYPLPENAEQISVEKAEEMVREAENAELVDDDGAEGRRTTTDGGERWENGGEVEDGTKTNTDNNRQVPFEELQNRLQQIERSVGKAALVAAHSANGSGGDGISSSAQIFTELVQQIGGFLLEMRKDFNDLNAQIDATETIIWTEQNEEEPTGLELVDEAFADVDALLRDDDDQKIEQCIDVSLSVHETVDALLSRVHKLEQYGEGEEEEQQTNKQQSRRLRRRSSSSNSSVAVIEEKRHCRRESD
uniref:PHYHIP_C domain-containing protein n=1 Tax=Globodera pallida TaxID=36090 RepID=A0A183BQP4_GLOPA